MNRHFGCIAAICVAFTMVLGCNRPRLIPGDKLSAMYAEMLLADQWISQQNLYAAADTHFVYKPIFDKYKVTADDYRYSVATYLHDPEQFAKVFAKTMDILDGRLKEVIAADSLRTKRDSISRAEKLSWSKVRAPKLYKDILVGQYPSDTVCFGPDSARYSINIPVLDTMFKGPAIILRNDPKELADTLAVKDTVAVADAAEALEPVENDRPVRGRVLKEQRGAGLPVNRELRNDERRPGLRTNNQPQAGGIARNKPAAAEGKAL